MKQSVYNFYSSFNNPSDLGADKLWANGSNELIGREDTVIGKDYDMV